MTLIATLLLLAGTAQEPPRPQVLPEAIRVERVFVDRRVLARKAYFD